MTPNDLFAENTTLAKVMARRYKFANEELDDINSDALLGLWQAATRWDQAQGVPFGAYARTRIHGQIIDGRIKRDPRPSGYLGSYSKQESLDMFEEVLYLIDDTDDIDDLIEKIYREQRIMAIKKASVSFSLRQRYIIKELLANRTARSIAAELNVSESAISSHLKICTQKIREKLTRIGFIEE